MAKSDNNLRIRHQSFSDVVREKDRPTKQLTFWKRIKQKFAQVQDRYSKFKNDHPILGKILTLATSRTTTRIIMSK